MLAPRTLGVDHHLNHANDPAFTKAQEIAEK